MLEEAQRENLLVTGLIYVEPGKPSLTDTYDLVDTPLNRLAESDLRPSRELLDSVNAMMF